MSSPAAQYSAPGRRRASGAASSPASGDDSFLSPVPAPTNFTKVNKTPDTSNKRVESVYSRLKEGAVANRERELGTVLHSLVARQEKDGLLLLLEQGADPNGSESAPFTPLYVAAEMNLPEYCTVLLRKGASVTRKNKSNKECALEAALKQEGKVKDMFLQHLARLEEGVAMRAAFASTEEADSPYRQPSRVGRKRQRTK